MTCPICDQKPMNCDCTETEKRQYSEICDLEELVDALHAKVPQWIPVGERMPKEGQRVLFFVNRKATSYKAAYAGVFIKCFNVWEYCEANERGWATAFVTHWMPVPADPTDAT